MPPGGETYRLYERFGENVLCLGSHEWLPYSKNAVCTKSSNNNLAFWTISGKYCKILWNCLLGVHVYPIGLEKRGQGSCLAI